MRAPVGLSQPCRTIEHRGATKFVARTYDACCGYKGHFVADGQLAEHDQVIDGHRQRYGHCQTQPAESSEQPSLAQEQTERAGCSRASSSSPSMQQFSVTGWVAGQTAHLHHRKVALSACPPPRQPSHALTATLTSLRTRGTAKRC